MPPNPLASPCLVIINENRTNLKAAMQANRHITFNFSHSYIKTISASDDPEIRPYIRDRFVRPSQDQILNEFSIVLTRQPTQPLLFVIIGDLEPMWKLAFQRMILNKVAQPRWVLVISNTHIFEELMNYTLTSSGTYQPMQPDTQSSPSPISLINMVIPLGRFEFIFNDSSIPRHVTIHDMLQTPDLVCYSSNEIEIDVNKPIFFKAIA